MMINLHNQIDLLKSSRSLFHSEADFQFALAWEIQKSYPKANIRLEYCPAIFPNMHLDILVELDGKWFPIELKYKTLKMNVDIGGEYFNLKNHGAQDLGRYDFWIDVERIEQLKQSIDNYEKGFVIMLSNDPSYWVNPRSNKETVCDSFRIHDCSNTKGTLSWVGNPSSGTIKNREKSIELNGEYRLLWNTYSTLSNGRSGTFRYLLLEI